MLQILADRVRLCSHLDVYRRKYKSFVLNNQPICYIIELKAREETDWVLQRRQSGILLVHHG